MNQSIRQRIVLVLLMLIMLATAILYLLGYQIVPMWPFFRRTKPKKTTANAGGTGVVGSTAPSSERVSTSASPSTSANLAFHFGYEDNYSQYNPANKFGRFVVADGIPVVCDIGHSTLGTVWSANTPWDELGFTHVTRRTFKYDELARFLALPQSKRAFGLNADHHIFNHDSVVNTSSAQIVQAVDTYYANNPNDNNNDLTAIDYEVDDPTLNIQTQKWIDFINRIKLRSGNGKITIYGRGSTNPIIYSGFTEQTFWDWGVINFWNQLKSYLDYENGQVYVGEPFDPADSGIIRELLSMYELTNAFEPKKNLCHLKGFRENYGSYTSASKQIAQAMAYVPFFTRNGSWYWGTEGKPEFGRALDDFIAARKVCSQFNDIIGNAVPVIPNVTYNGQTFGNDADYINAMHPTNPSRYSAWIVGTTVPVLVRAIRNGSEGGLFLTRVGGNDTGTDTITVRIGNYTNTFTVTNRNWQVYRINGI